MTVYIYKFSSCQNRYGVTINLESTILPISACKSGNWIYWKSIQVSQGESSRIGAVSNS